MDYFVETLWLLLRSIFGQVFFPFFCEKINEKKFMQKSIEKITLKKLR